MAELTVAVLGLDRLGVSIAQRLSTYMKKGGQHQFRMVGYDSREDFEKPARKQKVFEKVERHAYTAVESADLVIMNLPYEDLRAGYEVVAPSLRMAPSSSTAPSSSSRRLNGRRNTSATRITGSALRR